MDRTEYASLLDGLLAPFDLSDELACRRAHNRCKEYAEGHLRGDPGVNLFLALAAERLGQPRIHFSVVQGMVHLPEGARLHLAYTDQGGPTLTGNPDGLRYLSDLCSALSDAPAPHEHVHLYTGEPPLFGSSYRLTLYREPDDWFDQFAVGPDDAAGAEQDGGSDLPSRHPRRELDVHAVKALCFVSSAHVPPPLLLRPGRLYRVFGRAVYTGSGAWAKCLYGDESDDMYVFSLVDDADEPLDLALHRDDPEVQYFTASDLNQIAPGGRRLRGE